MSDSRKAWLKGLVSGLVISMIVSVWSPEWLFGERKRYTETYLSLHNDAPSVSTLVLDGSQTSLDITHRNSDSDAPEISLFTVSPVFHVTPSRVQSVCIAQAELNFDDTELWTAHIRLKEPEDLIQAMNAAGVYEDTNNRPFGMLKFSEPTSGYRGNISVSRFARESILNATDSRTSPHEFAVHFNEKYVPEVSQALLALTEDYKVPPCPNLPDLTVYNRWKSQWLEGEPGVINLASGWAEKYR